MQGRRPVNPYHRGQIYREQESVFEKQGLVRYDILRVFKKQDPFLTNCYSATFKESLETLGELKFISFDRKTNSKTSYRHVVAVVGPQNDLEKARLNGKKLQRRLKKMHHDNDHNLTDKQFEILSDVTCHPYRHGAALAWQKEFNRHSLVPNHEAIYARTAVRYFDLAQRQGWLARATEEAFLRFKKTLKFQIEPHRVDIKAAVQMYCESINLPLEDDHPPIGPGSGGGGGGMGGGTPGGPPRTTAGGPYGSTSGGTPMGETPGGMGTTAGGPTGGTAGGYIGEIEAEDWGPMDHLRSAVWEDDIGAVAVGRPDGSAWEYSFEKLMELRTHFVDHPANFMETLLRVQPVFKPGAGFEFLELNQNDFVCSRADMQGGPSGGGPSAGNGTGDGGNQDDEYEVVIREVPVNPEGDTTNTTLTPAEETIAVLEPTKDGKPEDEADPAEDQQPKFSTPPPSALVPEPKPVNGAHDKEKESDEKESNDPHPVGFAPALDNKANEDAVDEPFLVTPKKSADPKSASTWLKPEAPAFVPTARKAGQDKAGDRPPFSPDRRAPEFSPARPAAKAAGPQPARREDPYDSRPYWERADAQRDRPQGSYDRPPNASGGPNAYYNERGGAYDSKPRTDRPPNGYDDRRGGAGYDQRGDQRGDQRHDDPYYRQGGGQGGDYYNRDQRGGDYYGGRPNHNDRRPPPPKGAPYYDNRSREHNGGYYGDRRGPQESYASPATSSIPVPPKSKKSKKNKKPSSRDADQKSKILIPPLSPKAPRGLRVPGINSREPPRDFQGGWGPRNGGYDRPQNEHYGGGRNEHYGRPPPPAPGGYTREPYPPRNPNPPPPRNPDPWAAPDRSNPPPRRDNSYNSDYGGSPSRPKKKHANGMSSATTSLPKAKKDAKKNSYINMMMDL